MDKQFISRQQTNTKTPNNVRSSRLMIVTFNIIFRVEATGVTDEGVTELKGVHEILICSIITNNEKYNTHSKV